MRACVCLWGCAGWVMVVGRWGQGGWAGGSGRGLGMVGEGGDWRYRVARHGLYN